MVAVSARYDAVADSYASGADRYDGSAVSTLLGLLGTSVEERALDLACGHGLLARELARRGATVTAIDLSGELLQRARSHADSAELAIDYINGDVADPGVLEGSEFDLVVSNFGLSDIDDLDGVCQTVARVLVAGGRFAFSILHPCFAGAPGVSGSWPADGSYYDERWWRADGELSVLRQQVGANHRMLSTYFNALTRHGFAVDEVCEPRPETDWAEARPGASAQPVYLVVLCRRVAGPSSGSP
jgi:2-polyprenyl-3-methyl-5-hydroxy-6-metoxy-1,4-benzoquinol methylase